MTQLLKIEQAARAIAECKTVDEAKSIRDKAAAVGVYLRSINAAISSQQDAAEIRLRAERKMGEVLKQTPKAEGAREKGTRRGTDIGPRQTPTLVSIGVTKKESSRSQRLAAIPDEEFDARVAEARANQERLTTGAILSEARRLKRTQKLIEISRANEPLSVVGRRFPILYADPPWRYEHVKTESRAIENQYPTMTLDEICGLDVPCVSTDDAVLFLWATSPKLAEAMHVIDAWGFVYRSSIVWDKEQIGMGYWARQQHELLLIATRGNPPTPRADRRPRSVFRIPRGEHSTKPDEFYGVIESMFPELPRLELFARGECREGWTGWGNQST